MHDDPETEWLFAKAIFSTQRQVKQPGYLRHMRGCVKTGANRLARGFEAGIGRIDVEIQRIGHITGNQRANAVVNVFAAVQNPHHLIQIHQRRIAILARFGVQGLNRGASGSDVNISVADVEPQLFIESGQTDLMTGASKRRFDLTACKGDATVVTLTGALFNQPTRQPLRRVGDAYLVQYLERDLGNLLTLGFTEGPIATTLETGRPVGDDRFCPRPAASIAAFCFQSSFQTLSIAMSKIFSASSISDFSIMSGGMKLIRSGGIDRR